MLQTILYYSQDRIINQEAHQSRYLQDCKSQKNEHQITSVLEAIWIKNNWEEHIIALKQFSLKDILVTISTLELLKDSK